MTVSVESRQAGRDGLIGAFLRESGWGDAVRAPLAGDASTRRYFRISRGDERAVLMDAPPGAEAAACPPGAGESERRALGYNAVARLAGPNVAAFAALSGHLISLGLSAPRVLAADAAHGFLLLEDLGDGLYTRAIAEGGPEAAMYEAAIEALAKLHGAPAPAALGGHHVQDYDRVAALAEAGLFLDWYMDKHAAKGSRVSDSARADWDAAWTEALDAARPARPVLVLRDYHADNLIWLPGRHAEGRAGLIDFQDGLAGHPAYDFVSLTEDARRDVDPRLADRLKERYLALTGADRTDFELGCAVWAGQRNAKILGIFVRLCVRDSKPRYLDYLPRVERLFANDISHPALGGVRDWIGRHAPVLLKGGS